ncbi:uncharacterized protein BJX67DRAFT_351219 [Aspergillus lucknowensis]|uniref:Uncharacterized protein n=1 Tax=Aspergillus lucknowensis TaxID=176173 RepID=A0ABR4LUD0_9EURO
MVQTLLSIEATSQVKSPSGDRALLGVKTLDCKHEAQESGQLQWLHMSQEMEFSDFATRALEAAGYRKEQAAGLLETIDVFLSDYERSCFQGKRFRQAASISFGRGRPLDGRGKSEMHLLVVPYFLLQNTQERNGSHGSKVHLVQALVQSAYHLNSSIAREHQQAVQRLYKHVSETIHVPELWVLSIGKKFIATCSPTPLYDGQRSLITTRIMGRHSFPPTIRITMDADFVFYLDSEQCSVWFEFTYRVHCTLSAALDQSIEWGNLEYRLESDGSLINGRIWPSLLRSIPGDKPLLILATPAKAPHPSGRSPSLIPLERTGGTKPSKGESADTVSASTKVLDPKTLEEYKIPYKLDSPKPGAEMTITVTRALTELDRKILYDHTRRLHAMENNEAPPRKRINDIMDPYYWPPAHVVDAAKLQAKNDAAHSYNSQSGNYGQLSGEGKEPFSHSGPDPETQPIFLWSIRQDTRTGSSGHGQVTPDEKPTSMQWMKALVAYIHYEILFNADVRSAKNYNNLPLKTKQDAERELARIQEASSLNNHWASLMSSFIGSVNVFLDLFIDRDYNCTVRGKIWAAVYTIIQTLSLPSRSAVFLFQCEMISIPFLRIVKGLKTLRDGLFGVDTLYITPSMVQIFFQIILLLADSSSEASRLLEEFQSKRDDDQLEIIMEESDQPHAAQTLLRRGTNNSENVEDETLWQRTLREGPPTEDDGDEVTEKGSYDEDHSSTGTESPSSDGPDYEQRQFFIHVNRHIDQVFAYIDQAKNECNAMFRSEDSYPTYNGVDHAKIIALILETTMRGHSTCQSIPTLDIEDIYVTYTTSLQLQARNRPSKNLLLDLNLLREEVDIILTNISGQLDVINVLYVDEDDGDSSPIATIHGSNTLAFEASYSPTLDGGVVVNKSTRKLLQDIQTRLEERRDVFDELKDRITKLESQIVQRVDIIQEDHGKAILVFTIVSTIFLPLSFVSSYLGMNASDIRDMELSQALFWEIAAPFTAVVITAVLVAAYNAGRILGWLSRGAAVV